MNRASCAVLGAVLLVVAGCAGPAPCLEFAMRDVQSTKDLRGYGNYTITESVRVCTQRAPVG